MDMRCPVEKRVCKDCINTDSFYPKKLRFLIQTQHFHSLMCSFGGFIEETENIQW